ncbi:MAG TPA: guanylate kinase [Myxococcota bacterium]|nr:guanylate kinase [Myxococcota bacterium]
MIARAGFPVVVAAPSGTGKTTVCRAVVDGDPGIEFSVSHTTRPIRPGERDGVDYHFVSREEFARLVAEGAFLEWAEYNGNCYGTSWAALDAPLPSGRDLLLEIEVQGARQVRERRADARFIFLLPPALAALRERLEQRGSDDAPAIARRLEIARLEIEEGARFDYAVVNDRLDVCVREVLAILAAERMGDTARLRERHAPGPAIRKLLAG